MARNQEKAQSMLYKFREAQLIDLGLARSRNRPRNPRHCDSVNDAQGYRREILQEISFKVTRVKDVTINEFQIRELNDDINRLLELKKNWEQRIAYLGGPDFRKMGLSIIEREGQSIPGTSGGYKYFGRARELPGVRELFESGPARPERIRTKDLYKCVDADYYGYLDEVDARLIKLEADQERKLGATSAVTTPVEKPLYRTDIPTQQHMQEYLLARKKQELIDEYAS